MPHPKGTRRRDAGAKGRPLRAATVAFAAAALLAWGGCQNPLTAHGSPPPWEPPSEAPLATPPVPTVDPLQRGEVDLPMGERIEAALAAARARPMGAPGAGVVNLDERPARDAAGRPPLNVEEARARLEQRFSEALKSRDLYERVWAFQYAAAFNRRQAVPVMLRELDDDGPNAALAASCLALMAGEHREVQQALIAGVRCKSPTVRLACVEAVGRLRLRDGYKPLMRLLDTEVNIRIRPMACDALGLLGDPDAIPRLKRIMESPEEIDLTKLSAAVGLARLNDVSGKQALLHALSHPHPAVQVLAVTGLAALNDADAPGLIAAALASRHDEVWIAALGLLPALDVYRTAAALREQLRSEHPLLRRRAALALGLLGSIEGLPGIRQALGEGHLAERQLAAELLGRLGRKEDAPLLVERLEDPHAPVRQAAAVALARLDARDALPALLNAAQAAVSPWANIGTPRDAPSRIQEQLVLLACIRTLRGETGELKLKAGPDRLSGRWPAYDRELFLRQVEMLKGYQLVSVLGAEGRARGAVLKDPAGRETLYLPGEMVAGGFRLEGLALPARGASGWATLSRSETRITLAAGKPAEVEIGRQDRKDLGIK